MAKYIIGLDIGTSSVKGVLMSADGKEQYPGKASFVYTCRPLRVPGRAQPALPRLLLLGPAWSLVPSALSSGSPTGAPLTLLLLSFLFAFSTLSPPGNHACLAHQGNPST